MTLTMPIFLHVCCADCLLRYLAAAGVPLPAPLHPFIQDYTSLPVLSDNIPTFHLVFYNPNIYPKTEYLARLRAVKSLAEKLSFPLTVLDYRPAEYFSLPAAQQQFHAVSPLTARCFQCQTLRLSRTLDFAISRLPTKVTFSTTMLASRYLPYEQITAIGHDLATQNNTNFYVPRFLIDPDTLHTSGYYKQNYCGCFFSLTDTTMRKFAK